MTTYYVGPSGNDANNGTTWALRKLTLNGAEDIPVAGGDTVYVGPGTYRETLTVDVSGSGGNPITYIGDYSGTNTDGVGGVVRITGSNDDQTATRNNAITATSKTHRNFSQFRFDLCATDNIYISSGTDWTIEKCYFDTRQNQQSIDCSGAGQSNIYVRNCFFDLGVFSSIVGVQFTHSSAVDNCGHVVENCIFIGSRLCIGVHRTGGIIVRNSTFLHGDGSTSYAVRVVSALTEGQTVTVNNCIFHDYYVGLSATALGELVEDYNTFWGCVVKRISVETGANSTIYPPLFDSRWFFEAASGGDMVTPFDLASYSPLVNLAGASPSTTDMRSVSVVGAQREWGALEYDPSLLIKSAGGSTVIVIED